MPLAAAPRTRSHGLLVLEGFHSRLLLLFGQMVTIDEQNSDDNAEVKMLMETKASVQLLVDCLSRDRSDPRYANVRFSPPGRPNDAASQGQGGKGSTE